MSLLNDVESNIIEAISALTTPPDPLFHTVRGASGPVNPAIQDALRRELMPAAYVIFLNEKLDPTTAILEFGPRFSILIADRSNRLTANPRQGDAPGPGVFELVSRVRTALDSLIPHSAPYTITPIACNALASDPRIAILQLTYLARINP